MRHFVRLSIVLVIASVLGSTLAASHVTAGPGRAPQPPERLVVFETFMRPG